MCKILPFPTFAYSSTIDHFPFLVSGEPSFPPDLGRSRTSVSDFVCTPHLRGVYRVIIGNLLGVFFDGYYMVDFRVHFTRPFVVFHSYVRNTRAHFRNFIAV